MAGSIPAGPGRIFISYRREETAYPAGWLFDRLAEHFGDGQVFKDVDSIELGDDFVEVIATAVGFCDVLLALIGNEWLTITDEHGRPRLDNPDDFVRLEIEAALTRNVRVIPILVDGARMPRADELPNSLTKLVRRQALELSPSRFDFDTSRLLRVLDRTLAEVQARSAAKESEAAVLPLQAAPAGEVPSPEQGAAGTAQAPPAEHGAASTRGAPPTEATGAPPTEATVDGDAQVPMETATDAGTREPATAGRVAPPLVAPPKEQPTSVRRWRGRATVAGGVVAGVVVLATLTVWLAPKGTEPGPPPTSPTRPHLPTGPWTSLPPPPLALESTGAAAFENKVWMAGGFDAGRQPSSNVLVYDPAGHAWSRGPGLPAPISHAALVSAGEELLLIGGYHTVSGSDTPVAAVRRLRRGASAWVDGPPLPMPLAAGAAAWDGNRVVFAGGVGSDRRPSAAVFALEAGSWRRVGTLSQPREHLAAASDGKGTVWFLAGEVHDPGGAIRSSYGDVDVVRGDIVRRAGTIGAPRGSLAGFWSAATGPCVLGGRDVDRRPSPTVQCLQRGVALPALPTARHGMGAAVVGGVLYTVGGAEANHLADRLASALPLRTAPRR